MDPGAQVGDEGARPQQAVVAVAEGGERAPAEEGPLQQFRRRGGDVGLQHLHALALFPLLPAPPGVRFAAHAASLNRRRTQERRGEKVKAAAKNPNMTMTMVAPEAMSAQ